MKSRVLQAIVRNSVECRRRDTATERAHLPKPAIIDQDNQDIGRVFQAKRSRDF